VTTSGSPEARTARALRAALDARVVGQEDAKQGVLLALVAREHAYLEGPPGCGKTLLAETLAAAAGARIAAIRFHRDTRESDLRGDVRLVRERAPGVERLRREATAAPLEAAEIAVLDDLPRAPGEALAPLLRVLSERRAAGRALPLETAIGTGIPAEAEAHADPLEPTQLDRFAIQIRMRPLLCGRDFGHAAELLLRGDAAPTPAALSAHERRALQERAAALRIEPAARAALASLAERLARTAGLEERALVSDRAFGRQALAILRAHACLRGAARVEAHDLRAVRYMVARRLPAEALPLVDALIEETIAHAPPDVGAVPGAHAGSRPGEAGEARGPAAPGPAGETSSELAAPRRASARAGAADVESLLRALSGRADRGKVEPDEDPAGAPRRWRRLRRLDELADADPLDAALFAEATLPELPRVHRRERRASGGLVAVLRDVSASMEGRLSRWAGEVVAGVVRAGARRRMRVGYVEFHHDAFRYAAGGRFFHRHYRRVLGLAATRRAEGRTNYQAPLAAALAEFRGRAGRARHVVLLTDGVPVVGDPTVAAERALARRLGVRIHTVFLGVGDCPEVLDLLSRETGGRGFVGRPGADGRLRVRPRAAAA
jgi:MoxR-like ATPase